MSNLAVIQPVKGSRDHRCYEQVTLENGMQVLLVQDPEAEFSAACISVGVGYFNDPQELPGLAHFLEHATHLGSEKYPDERAYKSFLSEHAGTSNASTTMEHTVYHYSVHHDYFEGALERLAGCVGWPLLRAETLAREVHAVHAEYTRNCTSDTRRLSQLRRTVSTNPPYCKFSTGNLETLWEGPQMHGLDVVGALRALWEEHYHAGNMTATLIDPRPLPELCAIALSVLQPIRAAPRPPRTPPLGAGAAEHPWSGNTGNWIEVVPMRDMTNVELVWALPLALTGSYKSKPWKLVSHLLGDEGEGSVCLLLKRKGWAQGLHTSFGDEGKAYGGFSFFHCSVDLTEEGLQHAQEVVQLVLAALRTIAQAPVGEWERVWTELKQLAALKFEYKEREEPEVYAQSLALRQHLYPALDLLTGPSLLNHFDAQGVEDLLNLLTAANCNVFVSGKSLGQRGTASGFTSERYYGAKYRLRPLPQQLRAAPAAAGHQAGLRLPAPNWAIPRTLSMASGDSGPPGSSPPTCLVDAPRMRVWHEMATSFGQPKGRVGICLWTWSVYESAEAYMTARLFCDLLNDSLMPTLYPASLAGSLAKVSIAPGRLEVTMSAYNEILPRLVAVLVGALNGFRVEPSRHTPLRHRLRQSLRNHANMSPGAKASYETDHLLLQPHFHSQKCLAALDDVEVAGLEAFFSNVKRRPLFAEIYVCGNIEAKEAVSLGNTIMQNLGLQEHTGNSNGKHAADSAAPSSPSPDLVQRGHHSIANLAPVAFPLPTVPQVLRLGALGRIEQPAYQTRHQAQAIDRSQPMLNRTPLFNSVFPFGGAAFSHQLVDSNPAGRDHAAQIYLQVVDVGATRAGAGTESTRADTCATMELLTAVCHRRAFHQLRTVEQLGYSVQNGMHSLHQVLGWYIRVQSPWKEPGQLEERMLNFLESLGDVLEALTEEQLEHYRASCRARLLDPPKTLQQLFASRWAQITASKRWFSERRDVALGLEQVTKKDLIDFWCHNIHPAGMYTRRLTVHIWRHGSTPAEEPATTATFPRSANPSDGQQMWPTLGNGAGPHHPRAGEQNGSKRPKWGVATRIQPLPITQVLELKSICWHFYPFKCCVNITDQSS